LCYLFEKVTFLVTWKK